METFFRELHAPKYHKQEAENRAERAAECAKRTEQLCEGSSCKTDSQCASEFCSDGVCTNWWWWLPLAIGALFYLCCCGCAIFAKLMDRRNRKKEMAKKEAEENRRVRELEEKSKAKEQP